MSYVIAIDGPAASGKGTLARVLAAALGFAHMDTGALYRAVGWRVLQAGGNPEDKDAAVVAALILKAALESGGDPAALLADPALKSDEAGQAASKVAAIPDVRTLLVDVQKSFAQNPGAPYKGAVLDGRDIGTVICPQAAVKLFVIADTEIRAQRRLKELQSAGIVVTYEAVLKDMRERDARDSGRQTAPMKPAEDAIVLDTGSLNQAEILDRALDIIRRTLPL